MSQKAASTARECVVVANRDLCTAKIGARHGYFFVKRTFDLVFSSLGLILCLPIWLVVAIAIKSEDGGPVFYKQTRIGKGGKEFTLYKFRSMRVGADEELEEIIAKNPKLAEEYEQNKKFHDDPRITKTGKRIRRFSIDETPQVFNILKGEMSLVGNRPYLPREKKSMQEYFDVIVREKPGLTGAWQTSGRNSISFEERLKIEYDYSNRQNAIVDLEIILKTAKSMLHGK